MNVSFENGNSTFYGRILCEIYQDLPIVVGRVVISSADRVFFDHSTNFCNLITNPKLNMFVTFLKRYLGKYFNTKLLGCPIKKGKYVAVENREVPKNLNEIVQLPKVPLGKTEIINITAIVKTKIAGKMKMLFTSVDMFKLV
jgi:hypothetical protein